MKNKHEEMMKFWTDRAMQFGQDPRGNTNDIWIREVELRAIEDVIRKYNPKNVLDFGCANGFTTKRLAENFPEINFVGIDINEDMIGFANDNQPLKNLSFKCLDVSKVDFSTAYDLIISVRVFQNMESIKKQINIVDVLIKKLSGNGQLFFIESYEDGYSQINGDRLSIGLPELPILPHLTLLNNEFNKHIEENMSLLDISSPTSSYYLITRLIYSKSAQLNGEPIDYDHQLHKLAALVPQVGVYGPQRAYLYQNRVVTPTKQQHPEIEKFTNERLERISNYQKNSDFSEAAKCWMNQSMKNMYVYNFDWLGRPIIQTPVDIVAMQELIWKVKPDLIIETGIAHGGSLIFSASMLAQLDMCEAIESGEMLDPRKSKRKVLGIDIDIRAHNRVAIEAHPLATRIEMIQGSSIDPDIITQVKTFAANYSRILICLDSNHTHEHVLAELEAYASLTSVGSYCVVFDTIVEDMPADMFPDRPWSPGDNPKTAVWEYLQTHSDFVIDKNIQHKLLITVAPDGYLKRVK